MSEQAHRPAAAAPDGQPPPVAVPWRHRVIAWIGNQLSRGVLAILLVVSLLANAGILVYLRLPKPPASATPTSPEVELGTFQFLASDPPGAPVRAARFSLYISLLDGVDRTARQHLLANQHRVHQAVEELLRTAHSGDFEDPSLAGLKRQMQEQINGVLRMRAISEVIITDLSLEREGPLTDGKPQTAGPATPTESPSS